MLSTKKNIKIAILDMYEGTANQGMRCIREILNQFAEINNLDLSWDEFEVRNQQQIPNLSYDVYISTGGPGSPVDSAESEWEIKYFNWIKQVEDFNNNEINFQKKQVFFICHSFQLACRYFKVATVCKRKSTSFGVFPTHLMMQGKEEQIFTGLHNPFYTVDSRDYQVVQPNHFKIHQMGATILALEKERPHIPLERAIMAIRFNQNMIGTQFHPEADAIGMSLHLQTDEKKKTVVDNFGIEKWQSMIDQLHDPEKIMWTYSHVLPNFLTAAIL
jgi:homoserine O-succinyltransferase/O-acetyltransferase